MTITGERVVASAISVKKTVAVEVSSAGFVSGVRLLSDVVRKWDTWDFSERVVAVAAVAHDRFVANLPNREGREPTLETVAADERRLKF